MLVNSSDWVCNQLKVDIICFSRTYGWLNVFVFRINKVDDSSDEEYYDEEDDGEDKAAAQYQSK